MTLLPSIVFHPAFYSAKIADAFIIVASVTSSSSATAVSRDVNFSKWPTPPEFSQIQNGRRCQKFKMAATVRHVGSTPPGGISCLTPPWHLPVPLGDTHQNLQRLFHLRQSWLPQVMSRLSKISAPKSLPADASDSWEPALTNGQIAEDLAGFHKM